MERSAARGMEQSDPRMPKSGRDVRDHGQHKNLHKDRSEDSRGVPMDKKRQSDASKRDSTCDKYKGGRRDPAMMFGMSHGMQMNLERTM